MEPRKYLEKFAAAVVKRSGISRQTVEAVLPHVFDEIRYQLTEGNLCVPIDGFGTFAAISYPERQRLYTYKGKHEHHTLPAMTKVKFAPTKNMQREVNAHQFDPTRRAFSRHPADPPIRRRKNMLYNKRNQVHIVTLPDKPEGPDQD